MTSLPPAPDAKTEKRCQVLTFFLSGAAVRQVVAPPTGATIHEVYWKNQDVCDLIIMQTVVC